MEEGKECENVDKTIEREEEEMKRECKEGEVLCTPRGEKKGRGGKEIEEKRRRERSSSLSILEFMSKKGDTECEVNIIKRKRDEKEKEIGLDLKIIKRSNKVRSSPAEKKQEEEEKNRNKLEDKKKEGAMITLLKEIKEEMKAMRNEIKKMNKKEERWRKREEKMEQRVYI